MVFDCFLIIGSLESPMSLSPAQSYFQPTSTYFHQNCQWFFDPPPSRQLVLEISTMQKGGNIMRLSSDVIPGPQKFLCTVYL